MSDGGEQVQETTSDDADSHSEPQRRIDRIHAANECHYVTNSVSSRPRCSLKAHSVIAICCYCTCVKSISYIDSSSSLIMAT